MDVDKNWNLILLFQKVSIEILYGKKYNFIILLKQNLVHVYVNLMTDINNIYIMIRLWPPYVTLCLGLIGFPSLSPDVWPFMQQQVAGWH